MIVKGRVIIFSNSQFEKIMVRRHLHGKMGVDNDREANRADKKWT